MRLRRDRRAAGSVIVKKWACRGVPPFPSSLPLLPQIGNHSISGLHVSGVGVAVCCQHVGFLPTDAPIDEHKAERRPYQQGYWRAVLERPPEHDEGIHLSESDAG